MKRLALIALIGLALPAGAQRVVMERAGAALSVGGGVASAGLLCADCPGERENSLGWYIRTTGALTPSFLVGIETQRWSKTSDRGRPDEERDRMFFLLGVAQWYPVREQGFFLKGGVGYGRVRLELPRQRISVESSGIALNAGAGIDFPFTPTVGLTLYADASTTYKPGVAEDRFNPFRTMTGNIVQIGAALSWY
jgi:hypothetical protein